MRLSVTSRRPGGVGQPPTSLRGTMGNGPTGQTRSSNPPPACGAACARVRRSRFGAWPHGKVHSGLIDSRKGALCPTGGFRMRFSVMPHMQNALFRRVRLSSPGQTWRHLTEKRILLPASHGKAHSATYVSRKGALCPTGGFRMRLSVTSRRPGCGTTPRQPEGRVAPSSRNGDDHVCDRPRPSYASTRQLKLCGFVQTTATRVQTPTREVPFSIAR